MNKPGISAKLKDVLNQVSSYDNVPRKKAKFQVRHIYCRILFGIYVLDHFMLERVSCHVVYSLAWL